MEFGVVDTELTALATAYKNREDALIGDEIAPATKTATSNFRYYVWDKKNNFTIPQTVVGKEGEFNKVRFGSRFENANTQDHGLSVDVSNQDISDFAAVGDSELLARNVTSLRDVMLLRREISIAQMVQDTNNYASSKAYSASDSWAAKTSDPLKDIEDAIISAIVPFNRMWLSQDSWVALRRHPNVIARLFPYSKSTVASVKETDLAAELGLEKIVVGKGLFNTAEPGKTPTIEPAFNASAGLYVYGEQAFINSRMNFITQVYLPQGEGGGAFGRLSVIPKELRPGEFGVKGGIRISIGEQLALVSQGSDLGYLFKDTTAA